MSSVKRQAFSDCSGFVHKVRVFWFIFFGESGNVTSLYPNDRFVTGKWDTRQFIEMNIEKAPKEVLQNAVNVTLFNTRHVLMILIVQKQWRLSRRPYSNPFKTGRYKTKIAHPLVSIASPEEALLEPFGDFVSASTQR